LAIARDLYRMINKTPGYKADMTRSGDYYIGLRQRLQRARKDKGDIFVAIHADAFKHPAAQGASVFALSQRGATSEAAHWLAKKENYSELGGVDLEDKSYMLRSVLLDLSQTATIGSSLQLGHDVLSSIGHVARLHNGRVEQARFVVLKSPDIPSILVETGFLSNPNEARRLSNRSYQQRMAKAIYQGVIRYFRQNPPPGTYVAEQRKHLKHYRVRRGDTLTGIAQQFDINVNQLKRANRMRSNNIHVGQVLTLPT